MATTSIVIAAILILLAFFVRGNPDLIIKSGISREEKEKADLRGLGKLWFRGLISLGIILCAVSLALWFLKLQTLSAVFLLFGLLIGLLVLTIMSGKHMPSSMQRKLHWSSGIIAASIAAMAAFVAVAAGEPKVEFGEETITFTGLYGQEIRYDDISELMITDTLPAISLRTNGFALGNILKGHFRTNNSGSCILLVNTDYSPYLYIGLNDGKKIYLNSKDPELPDTIIRKIKGKGFRQESNPKVSN